MRSIAALTLAAALLWTLDARAQESATKPAAGATAAPAPASPAATDAPQKWGRELGGHAFLPSHIIEDPFSYTAFATTFGLGAGQALGPQLQLQPPAILQDNKWYGYTGLGLGVLMNVRILEYLSARAAVAANAYLGTGNGSVLVVGSSARVTGDVGVKGSLPIGDTFRVAASFDVQYGPVYSILLAQGFADALNQCRVDPQGCSIALDQFLQTDDTVTYVGGLVGSWAPWPFLGATLSFQYLIPTKTGKASSSQNGVDLQAMVDFDAKPLLPWLPLGANLAYGIISPVGSSGVTTSQEYGFGFYYTGRPEMALGLEIDWKISRLESQLASQTTLAWVNFRYYWN